MAKLIPDELSKHSSPFLKGEHFDGEGQNLIIKGFSVIKASNEEYGAKEDSALFKQGKLQIGETFKYDFLTVDNEIDAEERTFETNSPGFFIAFNKLAPEGGEKVNIRREGKATKTRYFITIIK